MYSNASFIRRRFVIRSVIPCYPHDAKLRTTSDKMYHIDIKSESDERSMSNANNQAWTGTDVNGEHLRLSGSLRRVLLGDTHNLHEEGLLLGRERGRRQLVALSVLHLEGCNKGSALLSGIMWQRSLPVNACLKVT